MIRRWPTPARRPSSPSACATSSCHSTATEERRRSATPTVGRIRSRNSSPTWRRWPRPRWPVQPRRHLRLPRPVLRTARAVARVRRGGRDPRRGELRAAAAPPMRVAAVALAAAVAAAPAGSAPSRVQVVAREFSLSLSRSRLHPGRALVELVNFGEDVHDLRLRRVGGTRTFGVAPLQTGERTELRLRLLRGRYVLWCSIADHRSRGMHATLVVR